MYPVAVTAGNTFVLKPSEAVAGASNLLVELLHKAELPPGVVNMVHGGRPTVERMIEHPDIRAISFVGGNVAGENIYLKANANGKRVQSNMGAKNHGVIMPDANKEDTLNALVGSSMGASGQRCMALSTAVFVGNTADWIPDLVERCKKLKMGSGIH